MSLQLSEQEKVLINYYYEPIENWLETKIINIPSSFKLYKQIINFLSEKLKIGDIKNTEDLLKLVDRSYLELNKEFGINKLTELLYDIPPQILKTYYCICEEILDLFSDHLIQRQPTIRVHFQDDNTYQFYPFWHSDPILGHPPYEKNIWIPLTKPNSKTKHGFTLSNPKISSNIFKKYCESSPYESKNKNEVIHNNSFNNQSKLIDCSQGEGVVFDSRIFHSAVPHRTNPRISLDIRIMDTKYLSFPYPIFRGLGRKKIKFDSKNFFISKEELMILKNHH